MAFQNGFVGIIDWACITHKSAVAFGFCQNSCANAAFCRTQDGDMFNTANHLILRVIMANTASMMPTIQKRVTIFTSL